MKYVTAGTEGLADQMNATVGDPNAIATEAPSDGGAPIPQGSMAEALGRLPGQLADSAQEELTPLVAAATGGLKSVFETKDFLFGDTPPPERSGIRTWNDETNAEVTKDSLFNGLASGIGQFSVAMMGLGKVGMVAKSLPWIGDAITAGVHTAEALKGGTAALEAGKAALAGAVAFDPHENRLSNLIQDTPLANPVNAWLAAKPGDSAAWGRVKNAMESLGMDAAVIGSLKVGGVVWKKLKAGDQAGAKRTITNYQTQNGIGQEDVPTEPQSGVPDAGAVAPVDGGNTPQAAPSAGPEASSTPTPEATPLEPAATPVDHYENLKGQFADTPIKPLEDKSLPETVYHGTSQGDFDKFDPYRGEYGLMGSGSYFTEDPKVAIDYTKKGRGTEPTLHTAKLDIKNAMDMDAPADLEKWKKTFGDYIDDLDHNGEPLDLTGKTNEEVYRMVEEGLSQEMIPKWEGAEMMQEGLMSMGHDGVTHVGGGRVKKSDGTKHRVWIAFDDHQITKTGSHPVNPPKVEEPDSPSLPDTDEEPHGVAPEPVAGPEEPAGYTPEDGARLAEPWSDNPEITANPTQVMTEGNLRKPTPFKDQVAYDKTDVQAQQPASGIGPASGPGVVDLMNQSLEQAEKDWDSMDVHGDWSHQADAGYFARPLDKRFYDSFRTDTDVVNMMDLLTTRKAEELAAKGYRNILTDAKLQRQVKAFASLANMDPAGLMGLLAQGAKDSETAAARMIVTGSLTAKFFQDASMLAMRLKMGDFAEFGSQEAMEQAIAKRFSSAVTLLKMTDQVRANAGRQLRALRGKPFDPSKFEGLTKERFYDLLAQSQGNPDKLKYLADPSLYAKIMDTVNYLRIGSLISGPTTQIINIATNGYMVGARPLERILGSLPGAALGNDASRSLIKENLRQYTYMGSALYDGFGQAVKAIMANESQIKPHGSEVQGGGTTAGKWQVAGSQAINGQYFRKWDSIPNLLYNAFSVPMTAAGVPSRMLGGVDELMKQIVYRSKLAARGHTEAVQQAIDAGLKGDAADQFIKSYVKDKLDGAFDAEGRGLDADALREANIATFQQDLLPNSLGKGVQTLISNDKTKLVRLILPFVKTPTNVLRYGVKMTPGLNILQQEYRQALFQSTNPELKAQAVGQMSTGALFMGAAAYLGAQGMITGGGSSDPKVKAQVLATGWRPYSIVWKNKDGTTTYYPFNRFDPIALPFGIIADIQDAMHVAGEGGEDAPHIASAIGALGVSLAKQLTQRTYLLSLKQALDAIQDPGNKGETFFGSMTQSLVPFSAATRQMSTDPYMRDARTIADKMLEAVPGYTSQVPKKMDWLGQPIINRQGLWTDDNGTVVDKEVQRLSMLPEGSVISAPNPVWNKVDLRDITLKDGTNAYQKYQELAGRPSPKSPSLRTTVANVMRSDAYQRAPDGDIGTRGTKLWILNSKAVSKYRDAAGREMRAIPEVRDAILKSQRKVVDYYAHLKDPNGNGAAKPEGVMGIVQGLTSGAQAGAMDQ